ncbi:hypothetical protein L1987_59827 [Smallanthus sonchifolius]|uniref:Uncharacterized protein n=1 Tax=Smallanthus sonchifolius TaxID=185202 RepID=A0ACB9D6E8_9ASTR|nr:hypothetical protein L1987_59827 [Smallanthus sonchifolius]
MDNLIFCLGLTVYGNLIDSSGIGLLVYVFLFLSELIIQVIFYVVDIIVYHIMVVITQYNMGMLLWIEGIEYLMDDNVIGVYSLFCMQVQFTTHGP